MIRFHFSHPGRDAPRQRHSPSGIDDLWGSLFIEVDGVEISGGRLEDRLLPATTALVGAIARLLEGKARTAAVPFEEGAIELILVRRGNRARLSLVSLRRPTRVLVRDLEVEIRELAEAAGDAGRRLLLELEGPAEEAAALRALREACSGLARAWERPLEELPLGPPLSLRSRPPAGETAAPSIGFDIRDEEGILLDPGAVEGLHPLLLPGHLYLHAPDGEELCSVCGTPFLLLRDLSDAALRLLDAAREGEGGIFRLSLGWEGPEVEVDLRGGACTVAGRTVRCSPVALARALFAGALDFGGALLARQPALAENPWHASFLDEARERMALAEQLATPVRRRLSVEARAPLPRPAGAEPPLAAGSLRRVSLRTVFRAELRSIRSLHVDAGGGLWAIGRSGATRLFLADGSASATLRGSLAFAGGREPILQACGDGSLALHTAEGRERWRVDLGVAAIGSSWWPLAGGRCALVAEGTALLLCTREAGRPILRLEPPAAMHLEVAAAGRLAVAASDKGLLYGVDGQRGEVAWRVPIPIQPDRIAVYRDRLLLVEGDEAVGIAATSGAEVFRMRLPLEVGEVLPVPGGWVLAGRSSAGGEALALGPDGTIRWRARPNLGPASPALLRVGGAVYARGNEGVCRIERGRIRWNVPCEPGGAPVALRGVLALPGDALGLLDAETGRRLLVGGATSELPHADLLAAAGDLLVIADTDGRICVQRMAGALALVG